MENMICSPEMLRRRVVFSPICSTVPTRSPTVMKSPITNGLSMAIDNEAKMSPRMFCTASAAAMPPMPNPATSAVMSRPRLARIISTAIDQRASRPMKLSMDSVVALEASVSCLSGLICCGHSTRARLPQRAACSNSATTTVPSTTRPALAGRATNWMPIYAARISKNSDLVPEKASSTSAATGVPEALVYTMSRRRSTCLIKWNNAVAASAAPSAMVHLNRVFPYKMYAKRSISYSLKIYFTTETIIATGISLCQTGRLFL